LNSPHPQIINMQAKKSASRIPIEERPRKHCTKCDAITPWNSHNRCMTCQRKRSKEYAARLKTSGGAFSAETKANLMAAHPDSCPLCSTLWSKVPQHSQHPDTPWHFDHIVSPQLGGTNDPSNAQILCWPCNLKKLNKRALAA
jgi:5-methylcytosine-specific restriction endonuclease McrA